MAESPEPPQVLANALEVLANTAGTAAEGAVWRLEATRRDLDANLIRLPAGELIMEHEGPEIDVLVVVLDGSASAAGTMIRGAAPSIRRAWPKRSSSNMPAAT